MPTFTLKITTDNADFADDLPAAIARILKEAANKINKTGALAGPLRDVNGNTVGSYGTGRG